MANASCSTATLVSNLLTVTGSVSGTILVGMTITAAGVVPGVTITSLGTGSGQAGTYNCSSSASNVPSVEPMVFSLSWNMPLQGNASSPQIVDAGLAAGFAFIVASSVSGPSAGPGAEYQFGTHQAALYNAQGGSQVWHAVIPRQGTSVKPIFTVQQQSYSDVQPQVFKAPTVTSEVKNRPLTFIYASPQLHDPTYYLQPFLDFTGGPQAALGFGAEYQFGTHQAALYNSQIQSQVFKPIVRPPTSNNLVPLRTIHVQGQELNTDLTIQGWVKTVPVAQGWLVTMITAGPQLADLTVQANLSPARPFQSIAPAAPTNPGFFFAQPQFDTTQIPARVIKPPNVVAKVPLQPFISAAPSPSEQANSQQIQPQIFLTSLPGPSKKIQPVTIWIYEQQYDRTTFPQLVYGPTPTPIIVPTPAPVSPGPTVSFWTTDATHITADTINYTADGANLIGGGGPAINEGGKGGPAYTVSQTLRF